MSRFFAPVESLSVMIFDRQYFKCHKISTILQKKLGAHLSLNLLTIDLHTVRFVLNTPLLLFFALKQGGGI